MALTIRGLRARDKPAWLRLFRGYLDFYEARLDHGVIDATWQRLMTPAEGHHVGLVAVDEQAGDAVAGDAVAVIGLAHYLCHRSTWSPSWYCYLEDLFVDPAMRGKGAGRALIEAVYAAADAQRCTRTYWATQEFNHSARALYDKLATKSPFIQYRR